MQLTTSYSIPWSKITVFEAMFILNQHTGHIDGDNRTVEVQCNTKHF